MKRLFLYVLVLLCGSLHGQEYHVDFKSWGMNDGLSDRQVNYFYKDHSGLIWLCTRHGLNCFDGYSFRIYSKEKNLLPFQAVDCVAEDPDNMLWVLGGHNSGVNNLIILDPYTKRWVSWKDKTGGRQDEEFSYMRKFNDSTFMFGNPERPYFYTWQPRAGLRKVPFPVPVYVIVGTSDSNTLWLYDKSYHICEVRMDGTLLRSISKVPAPKMGNIPVSGFIALVSGQKRSYRHMTNVHLKADSAFTIDALHLFSPPGDERAFIGIDSIYLKEDELFSGQRRISSGLKEHPLIDFVHSSFFLKDNNTIWFSNGMGFGRFIISKSKFRKYFFSSIDSEIHFAYRNLLVTANRLYAAKEVAGTDIAWIDTTPGQRAANPKPGPGALLHYCLTRAWNGTIISINGRTLQTCRGIDSPWHASMMLRLPTLTFWKLCQVSPDTFLMGTGYGLAFFSLVRRDFTPFESYGRFPELGKALVLDIIPGEQGRYWICCDKGLYEYDLSQGVVARYSAADTGSHYFPSSEIQHLYRDSSGIYWVATAHGLIRWNRATHALRLYTREDGLSNSNIYAVYEDHKNRLWLSSDLGIMSLNKATGKVRTYLFEDGITNNEFNRVSHTSDSAGNIYFGSLNGVTSFNPDNFPDNDNDEKNAPLVITSLVQFDGTTNRLEDRTAAAVRTSKITLMPGDRFFTLNFSLLTYNDVIHTTYYWKIDGVDSAWNSMHEPALRVSGLPFGRRLLHIKAQGFDGRWGRNELLLEINVLRPVYLQAWFIGACLAVLFVILLVIFKWRTYLLEKENLRLDKIVKEKTNALEDTIGKLQLSSKQKDILMKEIHHRVKNNLQVISTLLKLQMAGVTDDAARKSLQESISRITSIALVHYHLYKGEQLSEIELSDFVKELFLQVSSVYHTTERAVVLCNKIPETEMDIDTALPVGLIINELMTNSFKYAYADCIDCKMEVSLIHSGSQFVLRYCDYGPGLPEGYDLGHSGSLGMTIIRSLSRQLGGGFSYNSSGKEFVISFLDAEARKKIA